MKIVLVLVLFLLALPSTVFAASATLNWQDNSGNETGFKVERGDNGAPLKEIGAVTGNVKTYVDNTVVAPPPANPPATNTYCYQVKAFNTAGSSGPSNMACVDFLGVALITIPAPASNLTATPTAATARKPAPAKNK
jgi:hypothetical protein